MWAAPCWWRSSAGRRQSDLTGTRPRTGRLANYDQRRASAIGPINRGTTCLVAEKGTRPASGFLVRCRTMCVDGFSRAATRSIPARKRYRGGMFQPGRGPGRSGLGSPSGDVPPLGGGGRRPGVTREGVSRHRLRPPLTISPQTRPHAGPGVQRSDRLRARRDEPEGGQLRLLQPEQKPIRRALPVIRTTRRGRSRRGGTGPGPGIHGSADDIPGRRKVLPLT